MIVNSSDPPCKNGDVWFTYELDINVYFLEISKFTLIKMVFKVEPKPETVEQEDPRVRKLIQEFRQVRKIPQFLKVQTATKIAQIPKI